MKKREGCNTHEHLNIHLSTQQFLLKEIDMRKDNLLAAALFAATLLNTHTVFAADSDSPSPAAALTVRLVHAETSKWPQTVAATGSIAAWQEAIIGAEVTGLTIKRVYVEVGDRVKKGQLLAQLSAGTLEADLEAMKASLGEAEAAAREAHTHAERVKQLKDSAVMSAQAVDQVMAADASAQARVQSLKAQVHASEVRLAFTRITASDNGVISAREAIEGSLAQAGQELFRLQRDGRLEWRAEVPGAELEKIRAGQRVKLQPSGAAAVEGRVRLVAPKIDAATRTALVYVDLPAGGALRAGLFARGDFILGESPVLTLPQTAVLMRDGFSYVFQVDGNSKDNNKVRQQKVLLGRRQGDRVEIREGLDAQAQVVAAGVGFLADGDIVRVVDTLAAQSSEGSTPAVRAAR
jgi:RND family efflux transporter MFP subunit